MAVYRKFIFVCTGSDCKKNGCKGLLKEAKEVIKHDDHKGKYKLIKTKCMDFCKSGPILVYNNEVIKRCDKGKMKEVLNKG
ncbi:(2Fe-2S) ferredoxin domain-containing protein [Echinicola jeungdonensis]|uniref:NAD(P)H-dependent oxidoreductase subunit E n=1 Tax=Echinicola jeungdonensis TaxID=709343 RepID=A0ABV5J2M8_9BACT|nr:(2Fe-2S) ferredoxin domain-containing protein [Echinicola jeungdonensis]MDN3671054.1 (2Fe-2S) ferredoxin domain-containing protein [Echinicola jeungdonensis]